MTVTSDNWPRAAVVGIAGVSLTRPEAALLRALPPAGVILFRRNIADPPQLGALVAALRAVLPDSAVLMVDQEGGRVARLRPPHWGAHPPAAALGAVFSRAPQAGLRAAWLHGALIGAEAAAAGFDVVCAPVLDLRRPGQSDVVGDRGFAEDAEAVAALGAAMAEGLLAAGVQPVGKHVPGHGQARVDSHAALPAIEAPDAADLRPFRANASLPWMMTAHVLYRALDPANPATLSAPIIADLIRRDIGFAGVLASDDLAMGALSGPPESRAARALAAGCDVALYCAGDPAATEAVLRAAGPLGAAATRCLAAARALAATRRMALDPAAMRRERESLLS
jgi:beta-N-acetylhexosaminidase